MENQLRF